MFYSDEAVNDLLRYSKTFVDEIAKKKTKSNDFIPEQYVIFAGMVSYYGFEHIDAIYKAFSNAGFIDDHTPAQKDFENYSQTLAYCAVSILPRDNKYFIQRDIHHLYSPDEIYGDFFEELVHEVNHCVNSAFYPICKRNSLPVFRNGISISAIGSVDYTEAELLEESFNTLQTAEIMNHILSFGQYNIEDPSMRLVLSRLQGRKANKLGFGYQRITPGIYPLYSHPEFYPLLKENRISGDLLAIRNNFDQRVGAGSFMELASSIDHAWNDNDPRQAGKAYQLVSKYVHR